MDHKVCFLYKTGQEVWYIHKIKRVPKHGYISEINIHISYMGQDDYMSTKGCKRDPYTQTEFDSFTIEEWSGGCC